jgi:hypothetical protein
MKNIPFDKDFPELSKLRSRCVDAFEQAYSIVCQNRRQPDDKVSCFGAPVYLGDGISVQYEVCQPWVLYICSLWVDIERLEQDYDHCDWEESGFDPYTDFGWPQNPRSTAFNEAGLSSLQAAVFFAALVTRVTFAKLARAIRDVDWSWNYTKETLKIEPRPSEEVLRWQEFLREGISEILPVSDWSDGAADREWKSVLWQIEYEYQQAIKAVKPEQETKSDKDQPWRDDALDYISNSEAIVKFTDSKMPLSKLSKLLRPDGPIRYMRKGQRCKVHIGDFREYARKRYPPDEDAAEIAAEYWADIQARKEEEKARRQKRGNR